MSTGNKSYCWVRVLKDSSDSIDPARRMTVEPCPDVQATGDVQIRNWGRPPSAPVASLRAQVRGDGSGSDWVPGELAWRLEPPMLGRALSPVVFDFGPAFDSPEWAQQWIEGEGRAWAEEALTHVLMSCGCCEPGVPWVPASREVPRADYDNANRTPAAQSFDPAWWGPDFLRMHDRPIRIPLLDFEQLLTVDLPGADFADSRAECDQLFRLQQQRTPEQEAECRRQGQGLDALVWPLLDSTTANLAWFRTLAGRDFVDRLSTNVEQVIYQHKRKYMRCRPAQIDARLKPLFNGPRAIAGDRTSRQYPGHPAFPSGHATLAHTWSKVLSRLGVATARTDAVARILAANREVAGVHYPSDAVAGEALAEAIVQQLFSGSPVAEEFFAGWAAR